MRSRLEAERLEHAMQASHLRLGQWVDESEARMKVLVKRYGFPRPNQFQRVHLSWRRAARRLHPSKLEGF
jgi:hypothetical protein